MHSTNREAVLPIQHMPWLPTRYTASYQAVPGPRPLAARVPAGSGADLGSAKTEHRIIKLIRSTLLHRLGRVCHHDLSPMITSRVGDLCTLIVAWFEDVKQGGSVAVGRREVQQYHRILNQMVAKD